MLYRGGGVVKVRRGEYEGAPLLVVAGVVSGAVRQCGVDRGGGRWGPRSLLLCLAVSSQLHVYPPTTRVSCTLPYPWIYSLLPLPAFECLLRVCWRDGRDGRVDIVVDCACSLASVLLAVWCCKC